MTVDGHAYDWRMPVVIADASRKGSVVHIPGPVAGFPSRAIMPGLIVEKIREARRRGWVPGGGRGVFLWLKE